MEYLFPLKEIAKVSKSLLIEIAGVSENYKEVVSAEEIDFDACPVECPFKEFDNESKAFHCVNNCGYKNLRTLKKAEVIYVNERHKYKLTKKQENESSRIPKFLGLLFLELHFCTIDSLGIIQYASQKELAQRLGCNIRTVRAHLKHLVDLNYISMSQITNDLCSIQIINYDKYHLPAEQGGTGYVQMTKEFFLELIQLNDVNAIRIAIRKLLVFDEDVHLKKVAERAVLTYDKLKRFLPSNINYKKAIDKLLDKTAHMFTTQKSDTYIVFKFNEEFDGKMQKEIKSTVFGEELSTFIAEADKTVLVGEMNDLIDLSLEYGIDYVKQGLEDAFKFETETDEIIENLGGFVRVAIRNRINQHIVGYEYLIYYQELKVA